MPTMLESAAAVRAGALTAAHLVESALSAAGARAELNAMTYVDANAARELADTLDGDARRGQWRGPLHGVPITVKDLFQVRGMPMNASTRAPLPHLEPEEATVVGRMRAAGAIILGKANMHEIALGLSGELAWNGPVRNPHDPTRQAGGSSSGSAAGVAAGIGLASLGSDTAGSVRLPASFCGVVGFKPTWGRVPLDGALALSWTCDHAGVLAPTVADAHAAYQVMAAMDAPLRPALRDVGPRLGVPRRFIDGWLTPDTRMAWDGLLARAEKAGATLVDAEPDGLDLALSCYNPLRTAESAYVHREALANAPDGFSPVIRDNLLSGLNVTAQQYFAALDLRARIKRGMDAALSTCDGLLLPTAPGPAPKIGTTDIELERGPEPLRVAIIRLTLPFSLVGIPAISVPYARAGGMPLGAQIACASGRDAQVLELGAWLEKLSAESPV